MLHMVACGQEKKNTSITKNTSLDSTILSNAPNNNKRSVGEIKYKYYRDLLKEDPKFMTLYNSPKVEHINGLQILRISFLDSTRKVIKNFDLIEHIPFNNFKYKNLGYNSYGGNNYEITKLNEADEIVLPKTSLIVKSKDEKSKVILTTGFNVTKTDIDNKYTVVKYFLHSNLESEEKGYGRKKEFIEGINTYFVINIKGDIIAKWENTQINIDYPIVDDSGVFLAGYTFANTNEAIQIYNIATQKMIQEYSTIEKLSIPRVINNSFFFWETLRGKELEYKCLLVNMKKLTVYSKEFSSEERNNLFSIDEEHIVLKNNISSNLKQINIKK